VEIDVRVVKASPQAAKDVMNSLNKLALLKMAAVARRMLNNVTAEHTRHTSLQRL
jgi:hypothetical protein